MAKSLPSGFDPTRILAGLHRAMEFGEPTRTDDKATFVTVTVTTPTGVPVDENGVPFDPNAKPTRVPRSKQVPCAIEYYDRNDLQENLGPLTASRVKITLLDPEYQQVKGFDYVVIGGDRYAYRSTEPPVALGSIDVWSVWAVSEEES